MLSGEFAVVLTGRHMDDYKNCKNIFLIFFIFLIFDIFIWGQILFEGQNKNAELYFSKKISIIHPVSALYHP